MCAEISPVNAPSLLHDTFCPATATLRPLAASTAVEIAVNGGATITSQCRAFATCGQNAKKNPRVSASVLYIFQLPAITRRRVTMVSLQKKNASLVGESFDAWQLGAA